MKSETILIYNFVAYLLMFLYFLRKDNYRITVRNVPFVWLAFIAFASYEFYIQPGFEITVHYSKMTVLPFVYLFPALMFLFLPFRSLPDNSNWEGCLSISKLNKLINILNPFLLFLLVAYTYSAMNFSIAETRDIRQDLYEGNLRNPFFSTWITSTVCRLYVSSFVLLMCLAFYVLVYIEKKRLKHYFFVAAPYIITVEYAVSSANRAIILFLMMLSVFQFFLYKDRMSARQKRVMRMTGLLVGGSLFFLIVAMSFARFGDNAQLFFYKYAGESMINFNGLLFNEVRGTTDGIAYFWYIPYKLGLMEIPFNDLKGKWTYVETVTGVSAMYFYTIVGGLIFEFGKTWTMVIVAVLGRFLSRLFRQSNAPMTPVLVSWVAYNMFASVFLLPIQGDLGVISIAILFITYKWLNKTSVRHKTKMPAA